MTGYTSAASRRAFPHPALFAPDASEADVGVLESQRREPEAFESDEQAAVVVYDPGSLQDTDNLLSALALQ